MDMVILAGAALLWAVTALLAKGFEQLGQVGKGQPA